MDKKVKNFIFDVMNLTDKYKGMKINVRKYSITNIDGDVVDIIEILLENSHGVREKLCVTCYQIEQIYSEKELLSIIENKIQTIYIS